MGYSRTITHQDTGALLDVTSGATLAARHRARGPARGRGRLAAMTVRGARRDLALLLGGTLASTAGSALSIVAVLIHLRPLGSGWVAAAFAAEIRPVVLLAAPAGALVDRVRNRELLVGALAVQAGAVLLATTALAPGRQGWLLAALAVVGAGTSVANPTIQALLPRISGEAGATRAYGWWSAVNQGGFLVGAACAGVLVE